MDQFRSLFKFYWSKYDTKSLNNGRMLNNGQHEQSKLHYVKTCMWCAPHHFWVQHNCFRVLWQFARWNVTLHANYKQNTADYNNVMTWKLISWSQHACLDISRHLSLKVYTCVSHNHDILTKACFTMLLYCWKSRGVVTSFRLKHFSEACF